MKKNIVIVAAFILIIAFLLGFSNPLDLSNIISLQVSFKYVFLDIMFYIIAICLSYIGIPFYFFILFFEIIASGIVSAFFVYNFYLVGIIFSILLITFKLIIWFFLFLNGFYSLKLIKNNYKYFFKRHRINKENSKIYLKKILVINIILIAFSFINIIFNNQIIIPLAKHFLFL